MHTSSGLCIGAEGSQQANRVRRRSDALPAEVGSSFPDGPLYVRLPSPRLLKRAKHFPNEITADLGR